MVGIASSDKKFLSRVVEGVRNSAVLSKLCKSSQERSSQASSVVSAECVLEEKEASIRDEIGTLTTAVKEISEKLEEMKGEIRVVKGTVAEGATDSQALVSFFGKPLKTNSAVLKNGLKGQQTVNACPKPKAPTIQGQLPVCISRPLEEVKEDVAAHKKSLIIIGIPECTCVDCAYMVPSILLVPLLRAGLDVACLN
ncbi:MAG: hypothetical protein GY820_38855 [Gammaproteobacteria bacterium]|nr:hypothetical protein [Gammaproteobacteria bacterium]